VVTRISARRDRTRQLLLGELGRRGALTRTQLAAATGLSPSATAAGVADLLADGLMSEDDATRDAAVPRRGRRSTQLTLARPSGHVIGIDFGHMHVRVAVADTTAAVLAEAERSLDVDQRASAAIAAAADIIHELLGKAGVDRGQVLCVAAGVPGPLDRDRKVVSSPTILRSWIDLPAADELSRRLGLPVIIDNDADMGALGEKRYGAGRDYDDLVLLTLGTGIGGGIISGGRILHGFVGMAGELGHTTVSPTGNPCGCGNQGCLEKHASATAVVAMGRMMGLGDHLTSEAVYKLAAGGDEKAKAVFTAMGQALGTALATLVNIFNFPLYLLSGGMLPAWDLFAPTMMDEVRRRSFVFRNTPTRIDKATLGNEAGLYGAAYLPYEKHF